MVVIAWPPALDTGVWHERTALPPICTVQAPHWPRPQPNFVPRKSSTARSTQSSGMSAGTSTLTDLPLTLSVKGIAVILRQTFVLGANKKGAFAHDLVTCSEAARDGDGVAHRFTNRHLVRH